MRIVITWIAVILTVAALRETREVTMPLGVALFLAALAWPLQRRLERRLPPSASLALTLLIFWALLALSGGALALCANALAEGAAEYEQRFAGLLSRIVDWLHHKGVPPDLLKADPTQTLDRAIAALGGFAKGVYELLGQFVLVAVYFFLALLEVHAFQREFESGGRIPFGGEFLSAANEITTSIQQFILARTIISLAMGVLTTLFTWIIGLDFAIVWGLSAFFLNYIPVFGALVAVALPTLLALLAPTAGWLAPVTFIGLATIHLLLGNYADPWIQGRYLSLSPLVLFFSVTFWGWVWGVPGVLISVPLTAAFIIVCKHFDKTRWIADLLTKEVAPAPEPVAPAGSLAGAEDAPPTPR